MSWFKVDDGLWGHPKWLAATPGARALWVTAGSWCADQLTDGRVPQHVLAVLAGRTREADELVRLGLWKPHEDGWEFHDWAQFQPSREQVQADRAAAKERQRRARERARESRRDTHRDSRVTSDVSHGPPDPTRPDPTQEPTVLEGAGAPGSTRTSRDDRFDEFWSLYPRLEGKGAAQKAWKSASKKADPDRILAGLQRQLPWFAAQLKAEGDFRPHASTWLNGERWGDAPIVPLTQRPDRAHLPEAWR